jgi:hypothetical protein
LRSSAIFDAVQIKTTKVAEVAPLTPKIIAAVKAISDKPIRFLMSGGSVKGVLQAIDLMLPLIDDNTKVIPGHGGFSSKKDVLAYRKNDRDGDLEYRAHGEIR